jgi:hypothetical protein
MRPPEKAGKYPQSIGIFAHLWDIGKNLQSGSEKWEQN